VLRRCEVKGVRKSAAIVALVLIVTLLLSPVVAAGRPPGDEAKSVTFAGDIVGQDELIVESKKKGVTVYGPTAGYVELEFQGDAWGDVFEGPHSGKLRITLEGEEATICVDFDWYFNEDVDAEVPLYHLEGFGAYSLGEGVYVITLQEQDTAIYEVEAHRTGKGKGSGFGLEFTNPTTIYEDALVYMTIEG
jgi:hypothetical protein